MAGGAILLFRAKMTADRLSRAFSAVIQASAHPEIFLEKLVDSLIFRQHVKSQSQV